MKQLVSISLRNKREMLEFINKQLSIDLTPYLEEYAARSRTYLGVHLEDLSRTDRDRVLYLLQDYGIKVEDNGGFGYAISYIR